MKTIYFEVDIPKALITKALKPVWPGVIWSPLSPTRSITLPDPPLPGPRWIQVRNRQCGICATDLSLLYLDADPAVSIAALPGLKRYYLGHEVVSEVVKVGPAVTSLQIGDRVIMDTRATGPTCFSQELTPCRHCREGNYARCENQSAGNGPVGVGGGLGDGYTAHESEVFKISRDLTDDQAILVEPASVAARAVLRRAPRPEERVLVIGCGTIGLLVVWAARIVAPRASVTAMARYPHQVEMARRLGADSVISDRDGYEEAARATGGKLYSSLLNNRMLLGGYDVIYDVVGTGRTIQDCLRWARAGGTVVVVGISPKILKTDLSPIWHQEVDLIGSVVHGAEEWKGRRYHGYELVIEWMTDKPLPTADFITHRFSWNDYKKAVATASSKKTGAIKVVLTIEG